MNYIKFYVNKLIGISYISILYVVISAVFSSLSKFLFRHVKLHVTPEDFKKTNRLIFIIKTLIEIAYVGILAFLVRKIVKKIYYPFDNLYGFQYKLLSEFQGGFLFSSALLLYDSNIIPNIKIITDSFLYDKYLKK